MTTRIYGQNIVAVPQLQNPAIMEMGATIPMETTHTTTAIAAALPRTIMETTHTMTAQETQLIKKLTIIIMVEVAKMWKWSMSLSILFTG